jgi:murein DD-endopeptidase MepM/ murein hydrolase activator NlpD
MARRTVLLVALAAGLLLAAPAAGDNSGKISALQARIAAMREHEAALNAQIAGVTAQIRSLEARVGDVSQRLSVLERDLELHQRRLDKLNALFQYESRRLAQLQGDYERVVEALSRRLIRIYESPDPSVVEVVLSAHSVEDALDQIRYLKAVAEQDRDITHAVGDARDEMRITRAKTKKVRTVVAAATRAVAVRTQQQRTLKRQLLASQSHLAGARRSKRHQLGQTRESEQEFVAEVNALAAADARVRARLAASQASSTSHPSVPSSAGLIWPIDGPVTSPFGMRWGRMHEGIDIGAATGTPIRAAAAGTVVYAGWESGYGNFTLIDHGRGLATAYGHQSSIGVSSGQGVAQGQVIGAVGCTGHCFGSHLHFEVRINGGPVDPLGYLG